MFSVFFNSGKATADLQKSIDQTVRSIAKDFFTSVKRLTPVRSGLAKRSWRLNEKSKSKFAVENPQPYIGRLDTGYSKQAPLGMTRPALREVKDKYRNRRIK
tara:strand:- start:383 stop:688 length:306 start_codon:yes stop_codon:yes gene_type:complete